MASEVKSDFSINGVRYIGIKSTVDSRTNKIDVGVAGTAQMIRQWIKQKYPNIPSSDYTWIKSRSFANGNAIDIYINDAPIQLYSKIQSELTTEFEYGVYHYGQQPSTTNIANKTDSGVPIDYGTKYLSIENRPPSDISAPIVDWGVLSQKYPKRVLKTSNPKVASGSGKNFDRGQLISDCAGWEINKKIYADGRVLYSANKKPNTPKNKTDWNIIKGEILTETGFSYSKYGNFQKFGVIASEAFVIAKLCEILSKYYVNTTSTQPTTTINTKTQNPKLREIADKLITTDKELLLQIGTNDVFAEQNLYSKNWADILLEIPMSSKNKMNISEIWKSELRFDLSKLTEKELIAVGVILKEQNANIINNVLGLLGLYGQKGIDLYKERYEKSPSVYLYPLWFETLRKNSPTQSPTPQAPTPTNVDPQKEEAIQISSLFRMADEVALQELNIASEDELYGSDTKQLKYGEKIQVAYNDIITKYPNITKTQKDTIVNVFDNLGYKALHNALALFGFWGDGYADLYVHYYEILPNTTLNPIYFGYYTNGTKKPAVVTPTITNVHIDPFQEANIIAKLFIKRNKTALDELGVLNTGGRSFIKKQEYEYSEKFKKIYYDIIAKYPNISERQKEIIMGKIIDAIDDVINNALGLLLFYGDVYQDNLINNFNNNPTNWLNPTYFIDDYQNVTQSAAATRESVEAIIKMYEIKAKRGDTAANSIIEMYKIKLKRL
jgi:hypothetical protein